MRYKRFLRLTAFCLAMAMVLGACSSPGSDSTDSSSNVLTSANSNSSSEQKPGGHEGNTSNAANDTTGEPDDDTYNGLPIPSLPIVGATSEDGQPEPPPLHGVFSIVVRYETSWAPYYGADMLAFDESGLNSMVAQLTQIDAVLTSQNVPASFELAYGPANALCQFHPNVLRSLISHGHVIGINTRTNGEVFRAIEALKDCEITPKTLSGLAAMADPPGPKNATATGLANAISIASIRDFEQITGVVSPLCESLNLASATNQYGTGAFTAPWRSAWTDGNACADKLSGQVVVIDQIPLSTTANENRISPTQYTSAEKALTQALGWTADHRYREPSDLPSPGMFSWGITVRLSDLVNAPVAPENAEQAENETDTTSEDNDGEAIEGEVESTEVAPEMPTHAAPEPPTRLHDEALEALAAWLETFVDQVEAGRLKWVPPGWIGATLRAAAP